MRVMTVNLPSKSVSSLATIKASSGHVEDLSRLEFERRTEMESVRGTLQKKQVRPARLSQVAYGLRCDSVV